MADGDEQAVGTEVDVTEAQDGGVLKTVLRHGAGDDRPTDGCDVRVHYVGTLHDTGEQFDSSRDRDEHFTFQLGRGMVIKAWDVGVATMRRGELARFVCRPDYAYGSAGSPPKVPPDATLVFEVELFDWRPEDISKEKDGGILRQRFEEGQKYTCPADGAAVTAYVTGYCNGSKFLESEVNWVVGECTEANLPEGVDKAIARMNKGERSRITLAPKWGYGPNGAPQYNIPPNAALTFEIHLTDFEKEKQSWELDAAGKLEMAQKYKERGTKFFQEGKLELAKKRYQKAADLLQYEDKLEGEHATQRHTIMLGALLNGALCALKLDEPVECVRLCDKAFLLEPDNVKGLYRRAMALAAQSEPEAAMTDLRRVLALEPNNKAAQLEIEKCRKAIKLVEAKQRAAFARMFKPTAHAAEASPSVADTQTTSASGDAEMQNGDAR